MITPTQHAFLERSGRHRTCATAPQRINCRPLASQTLPQSATARQQPGSPVLRSLGHLSTQTAPRLQQKLAWCHAPPASRHATVARPCTAAAAGEGPTGAMGPAAPAGQLPLSAEATRALRAAREQVSKLRNNTHNTRLESVDYNGMGTCSKFRAEAGGLGGGVLRALPQTVSYIVSSPSPNSLRNPARSGGPLHPTRAQVTLYNTVRVPTHSRYPCARTEGRWRLLVPRHITRHSMPGTPLLLILFTFPSVRTARPHVRGP